MKPTMTALLILAAFCCIGLPPAPAAEEFTGGINLSEMPNAESTLVTAQVKSREGEEIGKVHGITRGSDGKIRTVQVELAGPGQQGAIVSFDARSLVYIPAPNVIVTEISAAQAQDLPRLEK